MHGDGPGQAQGELRVGTQQLFLNLLLLLIEHVAHVLPHLTLDVEVHAVLCLHGDGALLLVQTGNDAQRAVDPALVLVVLDEDDLCAGLHLQLDGRGKRLLGEVALCPSLEQGGGARQGGQPLLVDVVDGVAAGGEGDS